MERDEIHARIEAIKTELAEKVAELDQLIAQLGDDRGSGRPPRFTIIKGGLGALALPITALGRAPRHALGVGVAAAVTGAAAVVMLVPAHTTSGGPGYAGSYISVPAPVLWRGSDTAATARLPALPGSTPAAAPIATGAAAAPLPPAPTRSPSAAPTPPAVTPTPRGPRTSAPPPSATSAVPTPGSSCLVIIDVSSILRVCVDH